MRKESASINKHYKAVQKLQKKLDFFVYFQILKFHKLAVLNDFLLNSESTSVPQP